MSKRNQNTTSFGSNKRKNSGAYFVDRAFLPRIKEVIILIF